MFSQNETFSRPSRFRSAVSFAGGHSTTSVPNPESTLGQGEGGRKLVEEAVSIKPPHQRPDLPIRHRPPARDGPHPTAERLSRQEKKRGKRKALSLLEAKLGRAVYHLWRKQVPFDVKRFLNG